jgi:membrane protease YdiL (CAAX protease family)
MNTDTDNFNLKTVIKASLTCVLIAVVFGEVYFRVGSLFSTTWLPAAVLNTFFAAIICLFWMKTKADDFELLKFKIEDQGKIYWSLFPGVGILLGSIIAVICSSLIGESTSSAGIGFASIAWVLWIPVIEEIVFRGAVSRFFITKFGLYSGAWFSALVFALVHSQPTFANLFAGNIGVPLGPFLLALICEFLVFRVGRLWPAMIFHAACNATPIIFGYFDSRWLDWLRMLYI